MRLINEIKIYNYIGKLNNFYNYIKYKIKLPKNYISKMDIMIPYENLRKIETIRKRKLNNFNEYSKKENIKALVYINRTKYKANLRLKGDFKDHYDDNLKYSIRVKLKKPSSEIGLKNFSIQHPKTRGWYFEKTLLDFAKSEGLITPKYSFIKVKKNTTDIGIMNIEEVYSQYSAHSNQRKEGIFLKFDDDIGNFYHTLYYSNFVSSEIKAFDYKKIKNKPILRSQYEKARGNLEKFARGYAKPSEIFDVKQFAKFFAICELFGSYHGLDFSNLFFYFNPISELLEPVFFDATPIEGAILNASMYKYNFVKYIFQDEIIFQNYIEQIGTMSERLLIELEKKLQEEAEELYYILKTELNDTPKYRFNLLKLRIKLLGGIAKKYPKYFIELTNNPKKYSINRVLKLIENNDLTKDEINNLVANDKKIENLKKQLNQIKVKPDVIKVRKYLPKLINISLFEKNNLIFLDMFNLIDFPVEIIKIKALLSNNTYKPIELKNIILPAKTNIGVPKKIITLELDGIEKLSEYKEIVVVARLSKNVRGYNAKNLIHYLDESKNIKKNNYKSINKAKYDNVLVDHTYKGISNRNNKKSISTDINVILKKYSWMSALSNSLIEVKKGKWLVHDEIIMPKKMGLKINSGTTLLFHKDAGIVLSGPLIIEGDVLNPVILKAFNTEWSGILVKNANKQSIIKNAFFSNLKSKPISSIGNSGSLTFWKSDIKIINSKFKNTSAEDFLNIVNSNFSIENSVFENAKSDAIDIDYGKGLIKNVRFSKIGGDALDFSGSTININGSNFSKIGDKAISVGEESKVVANNININESLIGIASKDGSSIEVKNITLNNIKLFSVMTYNKKPILGPAFAKINNIDGDKTSQKFLNQKKSKLLINDIFIFPKKIDTKTLYNNKILTNEK